MSVPRFIAKPDTWFKAGTECVLLDFLYDSRDDQGLPVKVGLFCGTRVCQNPPSEAGKPKGLEYEDEEVCGYNEFDIIE